MENIEKLKEKKWKGGRKKVDNKLLLKNKLQIHVTDDELNKINSEFDASGNKSKSDYLRKRLLNKGQKAIAVNPIEFIKQLDKIGTEVGRIGNNINQIAKYCHILAHEGNLSTQPINEFNRLMEQYMKSRRELVKAYRAVIRKV